MNGFINGVYTLKAEIQREFLMKLPSIIASGCFMVGIVGGICPHCFENNKNNINKRRK
jgi:hypothetical protein